MDLLKTLEEQSIINFTGRLNILLAGKRQFLGAIYIKEGRIVHCEYAGEAGAKSLFNLSFEFLDSVRDFEFLLEPEIIEDQSQSMNFTYEGFYEDLKTGYEKYRESKKFKPPGHIKLVINGPFIAEGPAIDEREFEVLSVTSDYSKVDDIYKNCNMNEYEITTSLVSLKKKGAFRILK